VKEIIYTEKATKPTAWYSQAVKTRNTVYLAGVCGDDPKTSKIMMGTIQEEATYALENLKATIEAAGGTLTDIVKVQVYVTDIAFMNDFNEIYRRYFPKDPPARIAMAIKDLSDGARLELDAIAVLE
jgi:reactive intermediate/imine deaminase